MCRDRQRAFQQILDTLTLPHTLSSSYSAELSVKVKRGQKENALKGKANGGNIPFGYTINSERNYEIDPLTAPIILEIFTQYANGQTVKEISEKLNSRGVFYRHKIQVHRKRQIVPHLYRWGTI